MTKVVKETGAKGFLRWVKLNQPMLYAEFLRKRGNASTLSGLGNAGDPIATATAGPAPSSWVTGIQNILSSAAQVYLTKNQLDQQKKIMELQLQRASQGLAPLNIDPANYGLQPTVGVGIAPSTQKLVMWIAIGLGAVYLLPKLLSARR